MKPTSRFSAGLLPVALVLALTASASGAYRPEFSIGTSSALGAATYPAITLDNIQGVDPTYLDTGRVTLYVPRGYGGPTFFPLGAPLGMFLGGVEERSSYADGEGTVTTANPVDYLDNSCSPGLHHAVWLLAFEYVDEIFHVPIYIDWARTPPEADYASSRIVFCLPSPGLPPPEGWQRAIALQDAFLYLHERAFANPVFTNPLRRGTYPWNAILVPYRPGTATLDTTQMLQITRYLRLPVQLGLSAKRYQRGKRRFATLTACVRELGRPVHPGARVEFRYGGATTDTSKRIASLRTNRRGCTTVRIPVKRTAYAWATAYVPGPKLSRCTPTLAPRCIAAGEPHILERWIRVLPS